MFSGILKPGAQPCQRLQHGVQGRESRTVSDRSCVPKSPACAVTCKLVYDNMDDWSYQDPLGLCSLSSALAKNPAGIAVLLVDNVFR